jgi:hypothetical protein
MLPCAHALDFSFLGVLTATNYNLSPAPVSTTPGTGFGVGITAGMDLTPFISMESGLLFKSHSFTFVSGAGSQAVASNFTQVPLWLRFSPISFISFNVGPYLAIPTSASPGANSWDYGFQAGASLRFGLVPSLKLRIDGLYEYGFPDLSSAGLATQNSRNVVVLAGLMLEFF